MDISAALTPNEVASLSVSERTLEDATRWLASADAGEPDQHIARDGGTFEESLRLKNTLDAVEEQGMHFCASSSPESPLILNAQLEHGHHGSSCRFYSTANISYMYLTKPPRYDTTLSFPTG